MSKFILNAGHAPIGILAWENLLIAITLFLYKKVRREPIPLHGRAIRFYVLVGLLGTLLPGFCSYTAISQLPAGIMSIIFASVPMFSLSIALIAGLERFAMIRVVGVLLGMGAIVLLIGPSTSLPDPAKVAFVFVGLLAPFFYGFEGNYIDARKPEDVDAINALLGGSVLVTVVAGSIAWRGGDLIDITQPWTAPLWVLFFVSLIHAFAYAGFIWLIGKTGAVFASQVSYIVTMTGVVASLIYLGESYSLYVWTALVLMLGGLALVQPRKAVEPAPH